MADDMGSQKSFAFVFPMASGHINPALPVARLLVASGHKVHFMCLEQMRDAIEDTGAVFYSTVACHPELYSGRELAVPAAFVLRKEYGLDGESYLLARSKLAVLAIELLLPGMQRWLREVEADALMYDPLMNSEAAYAAKTMDIPSVALLTVAGPGCYPSALKETLASSKCRLEDLLQALATYAPHLSAVSRLNQKYDFELTPGDWFDPLGYMPVLRHSTSTLVTTSEDLQDGLSPELAQIYEASNASFEAVGALLDKEGACRAGCHKIDHGDAAEGDTTAASDSEIMVAVRESKSSGRAVILVSMGTVITSDRKDVGWEGGLSEDEHCVSRGVTGRMLCQGAWGGAFDAFGHQGADAGPLLIVALGPQKNALGELKPPANALCAPAVAQVDILKVGVDVFLTHGGQNSFTEALSCGVPIVVCPGFGDQPVNAEKAVTLGVGLQVPRPYPEAGVEVAAAQQYRADVCKALTEVHVQASFRSAAVRCKERLQRTGGVPRAVEVMLSVANTRQERKSPPSITSSAAHVFQEGSRKAQA